LGKLLILAITNPQLTSPDMRPLLLNKVVLGGDSSLWARLMINLLRNQQLKIKLTNLQEDRFLAQRAIQLLRLI